MLHILPLHIAGAADLESGDIYLSQHCLKCATCLRTTLRHEMAHLLAGTTYHNLTWLRWLYRLGGSPPTNTFDVGQTSVALNVGQISGIQNILLDYHLLQAYRAFSQKILGTEGHWEVLGEVDGGPGEQRIRLYPTPKGSFPVVVVYYPVVNQFRSPQAKLLANEMLVAETKVMVGMARRKLAGIPLPDGGNFQMDGEALVTEGKEEKTQIIDKAINLGEPLPIVKW